MAERERESGKVDGGDADTCLPACHTILATSSCSLFALQVYPPLSHSYPFPISVLADAVEVGVAVEDAA